MIVITRLNELIGLKDYKGLPVFICFPLVKHQKISNLTLPSSSKSNDFMICPSVVKLASLTYTSATTTFWSEGLKAVPASKS